MSDDLRDLFQRSADEAPSLPPDVLSRAATRGRTLHRRRVTIVCAATAAVVALAIAAPLALRGAGGTDSAPVVSQPPSPSAPAVEPSDGPSVAPTTDPVAGAKVRIFVIMMGSGIPYLGVVPHRVPAPDLGRPGPLRAVQALLDTRRMLPWGFAGALNGWAPEPGGAPTRALDVRQEEGTITVELTGATPPTCDFCPPADLVIRQLVLTARAAYGSDDPVVILLDGHPLRPW